jgi:hypothetical protein
MPRPKPAARGPVQADFQQLQVHYGDCAHLNSAADIARSSRTRMPAKTSGRTTVWTRKVTAILAHRSSPSTLGRVQIRAAGSAGPRPRPVTQEASEASL